MSDDRDWGGLWLVGYVVAMAAAMLIALLLASCRTTSPACPPVERVIVRVVNRPCLQMQPPEPPSGTSDAALAQAYVALERYVRLYVVAACSE